MAMLFTKPRRKKLANNIAKLVKEITGVEMVLTNNPIDPSTIVMVFADHGAGVKSINGTLRWANFSVNKYGASVHIAFDDVDMAIKSCAGINKFTGKWNHYLWPNNDNGHDQSCDDMILAQISHIAKCIAP